MAHFDVQALGFTSEIAGRSQCGYRDPLSFHTGYRVSYTRRLHSVVIGPFTDIKYEVKALEIVLLLTVNVI